MGVLPPLELHERVSERTFRTVCGQMRGDVQGIDSEVGLLEKFCLGFAIPNRHITG